MKRKLSVAAVLSVASILVVGFVLNPFASATVPGTNELVNVNSSGTVGNSFVGGQSSVSQDGRYIVFRSAATDLVSGDTNGYWDIFLRDRVGGTTTRISISSAGVQANGSSDNPRISSTGRYVVFDSAATNLVSGGAPQYQVYLHDTTNQTTEIISVSSSGGSNNGVASRPDVSSDGRFVTFDSNSTNLVSGAGSGTHSEVYVRDRQNGTTQVVTSGDASSNGARMDCSGRFVVFVSSATNLVPGDTNGRGDVFLADRLGTSISLSNLTISSNSSSTRPTLSCNGNYVAFDSFATNLVAGDTNASNDVFRYDRVAGSLGRVSLSSSATEGNNDSSYATISGDGRYITYHSYATNLVSGDTNATVDIFLTDVSSGVVQRAAIASGGTQANGLNWQASISADGKYISYYSEASNLVSGDTNARADIFISATGEAGCSF